MDRRELLSMEIDKCNEIFEKRKQKRVLTTFICLSIAFYILGMLFGLMEGITGYLLGIIAAPICAGIYLYVNMAIIFLPIYAGALDESLILERLETELRLIEKGQE